MLSYLLENYSNNDHPKSREISKITNISPDIFDNAIKKITPRLRGREGPLRCIEAVKRSS